MRSRTLKITAVTLLVIVIAGALFINAIAGKALTVATNSVSRSLCDAAFLSHVDPDRIFAQEQLPNMRSIGWALRYHVDREKQQVRSTVLGTYGARAVYREGLGCVLVHGDAALPEPAGFKPQAITPAFDEPVVVPADPALRQALDRAFAEPDPAQPRQTKGIVVLHDGKIIAERYAPGYGPDTPIWGHSLSKSITNALIGILVGQGKLRVDQTASVAAWATAEDPHHTITIDQLLRMDSGLPFDETDSPVNPMSRMFFLENDMARYAATVPLVHPPGTAWAYSNLGYVLLARIAADAAGNNGAVDAERFVRDQLFAPLGMRSAVFETDLAGTLVGSSHVYASARDFARFGQLYLDDGLVNGRRILPEGWVAYSHSQTLKTGYGAGFWTNRVNEGSVPVWDAPWGIPQAPQDMFYARGAMGQYVVIVPSERLVIARLGISQHGGTGIGDLIAAVIAALHHTTPQ
jgi:CubicO group peptidase (beta-lactamase class C family)